MAIKNITIGATNYIGVDKVQLKETGEATYIDFVETSDSDAIAADILSTKTAYVNGTKLTGSMVNRGEGSEHIYFVDDEINLGAGYYSGGDISIHADEQAKIISSNIKAGVTILNVTGTVEGGNVDVNLIPGTGYVTSCPIEAYTGEGFSLYVGSTDCTTKYSGWLYIVTE